MDWRAGAKPLPCHFVRAVGQNLVSVHVGLGPAAGLPDRQREMVVEPALAHFFGRAADQRRDLVGEHAERKVGLRRCALLKREGADHSDRHLRALNRKDGKRTLCLRTPVAVGGNCHDAHRICLVSHSFGADHRPASTRSTISGASPR